MRAAKWRFSIMGLLEDARNIQRKDKSIDTFCASMLKYIEKERIEKETGA